MSNNELQTLVVTSKIYEDVQAGSCRALVTPEALEVGKSYSLRRAEVPHVLDFEVTHVINSGSIFVNSIQLKSQQLVQVEFVTSDGFGAGSGPDDLPYMNSHEKKKFNLADGTEVTLAEIHVGKYSNRLHLKHLSFLLAEEIGQLP